MGKDPVRSIRLRAVVAYPAVSVALLVTVALVFMSFGPSQGMALAASTPMDITTPTATTTETPSTTTTSASTASPAATPSPTATPSPSTGAGKALGAAPVNHHVLARIEGSYLEANYLPVDEPVPDAAQFQTFRVRFQVHNAGTATLAVTPRLEYRTEGSVGFSVVPEKPVKGIPFHTVREWVPSLGLGGGTMQGPLGEDISVADLRMGEGGGVAVSGHRSMGANPDQDMNLPSDSFTEQEFTVGLSIDAKYLTDYELRITDGGTALAGTQVATIRLGAAPAVQLSPGQRQGVAVVDPKAASTSAGAAYPLLSAQARVANTVAVSAVHVVSGPRAQSYPLTANALTAAASVPDPIHGPYSMTTDACAVCHRAHTAKAPNLLVKSGSPSSLCFECHGTGSQGANTDVQTQYNAVPPNVPSAREYYSHDAVDPNPPVKHTRSGLDEFSILSTGGVSNRHSECADCHNSHKANATTDSTQIRDVTTALSTGWSASGRLAGVSGVSVANGDAGTAPTYTFLSGANDAANEGEPVTNVSPITLEYQLCFKCHSGFTKLPQPIVGKTSKDWLDKGVEFNPANASYHPVEAAGKNDTAAMTASLTASSPYKLWNFSIGSTIRCLNCHASGTTPELLPAGTPPSNLTLPQPGSALPPHTSSNRGILLRPYRDRLLKPSTSASTTDAAYSAGDFGLCYVCHGEEPFLNSSSTATNFSLHAKHLSGLAGGSGTDIDVAGNGEGNAICAECHFRIHSTTNTVGAPGGSRLVNFAPNVQPVTGTEPITWTPGATAGSGTCMLTCHGKQHNPYPYSPYVP